MCEQMILAIFIIAVAFGAEAKFQMFSVLLCSSADRTFMLGYSRCHLRMDCFLKLLPSVNLSRSHMVVISGSKEENDKIQQGSKNGHAYWPCTVSRCTDKRICQIGNIQIRHPFDLHRNHKIKKYLHIRITGCKSQKD